MEIFDSVQEKMRLLENCLKEGVNIEKRLLKEVDIDHNQDHAAERFRNWALSNRVVPEGFAEYYEGCNLVRDIAREAFIKGALFHARLQNKGSEQLIQETKLYQNMDKNLPITDCFREHID